jgi:hypothetical protein
VRVDDDSPLVFAVAPGGTFSIQPPERPATQSAPVRSRGSKAQEEYDAKRRPQAVLLYRFLAASLETGRSWRECWALGESQESLEEYELNAGWDVGPIVVWLRSHDVDVIAEYDVTAGETRFYLAVPLADVPVP